MNTITITDAELLQAQAHIWNHTFSFMNFMSLKCAVELGIPDVIHNHGNSMTLSQLMDALKLDKAKAPYLHRLLRILIHSGFFLTTKSTVEANNDDNKENNYTIHNTTASKLLLKDHPASFVPSFQIALDPFSRTPWLHLTDWFKSSNDNLTPFATAFGRPLWDAVEQEPRFKKNFTQTMENDSWLASSLLVAGNNRKIFEGLNSLVDVGGGTGTMAKSIAEAFPEMKCTVLDLPQVVQGLEGTNNLSYVGGNMFQNIPPAHAILLKWIMHNWSDEECVEILKKCKEAIPSKERGGKVIIIDIILGDQSNDYTATQTQLYYDMLMLILVKGRQRTENEWRKLFFQAGFGNYKINSILGLRSVIEVYY